MNLAPYYSKLLIIWLPGTEPKSIKKDQQFKEFLISASY
jgi:hypothetical protein